MEFAAAVMKYGNEKNEPEEQTKISTVGVKL